MVPFGRAGIAELDLTAAFARPSEPTIGNSAPPWTGSGGNSPDRPGPHPAGQYQGGNLGHYDGLSGTDPSRPEISPHPHVGQLGAEQENARRYGIQGFNDRLQFRDRHAYWATGTQRTGVSPSVPGNPPNPLSDGPPRADLRTVNVSVNPQIGSDASRNQDDLSRPYTWLGQQDGTAVPIPGGVPGLWAEYGNRGLSSKIHDPSDGAGGPQLVYSGPPHGLHSDTMAGSKQVIDRYKATPQMRPVRLDRPDNSPINGQSYSQTVLPQGGAARGERPASHPGLSLRVSGRGWMGGPK